MQLQWPAMTIPAALNATHGWAGVSFTLIE